MGVNHQVFGQLQLGVGQGVYGLDTVLAIIVSNQEFQPDISALIKVGFPLCIKLVKVGLLLWESVDQ